MHSTYFLVHNYAGGGDSLGFFVMAMAIVIMCKRDKEKEE